MHAPYPIDLFTCVYSPGGRVNDHSLLYDGTHWHLFHIYLRKDRDDVIGHARSADLVNWEPLPDILPKGPGPSWESNPGGNAPYAITHDGVHHLFYSRYDQRPHPDPFFNPHFHDALQHIGLATSRDLMHWEKHPGNPLFHPAPFWSPWEDFQSNQFRPHACRDPHVMRIGDQFVMYYVAMTRQPNVAAVAYAVSDDLVHWRDQGPVHTVPVVWQGTAMCESPGVVQVGRRWHLFFKHGQYTQHSVADTPFAFPPARPLVANHACEVLAWGDKWYITHSGGNGLGLAGLIFDGDQPRVVALRDGPGSTP